MGIIVDVSCNFARCYGLEFEFTRSVSQETLATAIRQALPELPPERVQICGWDHHYNNKEWYVKTDGSCGLEVCSPKFRGPEGLESCAKVLRACYAVGAQTSPRTGFHLHYEIKDFRLGTLACLVSRWVKLEEIMFASVPRKRRGNHYCVGLSSKGDFLADKFYPTRELLHRSLHTRYQSLNVMNYESQKKIEFRIMEQPRNISDMLNWTFLFMHFVNICSAMNDEEDMPPNLCWYDLDDALGALYFLDDPSAGIQYNLGPLLMDVRDWWLRRIARYCGMRHKSRGTAERAKELVRSRDQRDKEKG